MWREYDDQGFLVYSFAETGGCHAPLSTSAHDWWVLYLVGGLVMAWNVLMTIRGDVRAEGCRWARIAPCRQPAE
jgi:cytochrome c oxidase cbb3-type subunit 1